MAQRKNKGPRHPKPPKATFEDASFVEETRRRYLSYALSVITSRALPDVRDGLKPVQRRILYTMYHELRLRSEARYRKSAAIVGEVMGKFHPHGDSAIYDALVRLAQDFSMRVRLVDGRGNFGSPDGDPAAAMRYTEAKLQKISDELMAELGRQTVPFRPNYDGTKIEPVVLPARFPNLLVNGSQGIAVGMATSIPPHNLGEVLSACIALIDDPQLDLKQVLKTVKGPDFPTGGELHADKKQLEEVYTKGQGVLKLRGEWKTEDEGRGGKDAPKIIIHSIPYAVERGSIVERIAELILAKKLPSVVDVRDESTDTCRIVCELKKGSDPELVMSYLYKHTPLSSNVQVNLTALVPTDKDDIAAPKRVDLLSMLRYFLDFRMEVVTKRIEYDLAELLKRIHILEGFEKIFDALDETLRIIRRSDGRKDAAQKLMKRFELTEEQVNAILELRLYKLAKLEILLIRKELDEKRKEASRLEKLLKSTSARWQLIRAELAEVKELYPSPRATKVRAKVAEVEYDPEAFIVDEDTMALVTQQGWVKRQQRIRDLESTRVREGDDVLSVIAGSTRSAVAFFSNLGACYVTRLVDLPQTSGYGSPVQTLFKLADGERIVSAMGYDERFLSVPEPSADSETPEGPYALAVTKGGLALRFSLRQHRDPSTRNGRRFCRLNAGDEVLSVQVADDNHRVCCLTRTGKVLVTRAKEISLLSGAGKGVMLIKLAKDDEIVTAGVLKKKGDELAAVHSSGKTHRVTFQSYEPVSRGGKGFALFKRGRLKDAIHSAPALPVFPE